MYMLQAPADEAGEAFALAPASTPAANATSVIMLALMLL
jgi:hypothetical protein